MREELTLKILENPVLLGVFFLVFDLGEILRMPLVSLRRIEKGWAVMYDDGGLASRAERFCYDEHWQNKTFGVCVY